MGSNPTGTATEYPAILVIPGYFFALNRLQVPSAHAERRIVARMSNDASEPDAASPEESESTNREPADTSAPQAQADARAELENVLEDLDGYGER